MSCRCVGERSRAARQGCDELTTLRSQAGVGGLAALGLPAGMGEKEAAGTGWWWFTGGGVMNGERYRRRVSGLCSDSSLQ